MDLDTLRMFTIVARFRSISQAAIDLDISQPALSRRLKGLESRVGATLLHRAGGGVGLTPQGELLLATAQSMLGDYERVTDLISSTNDEVKGTVAVRLPHPMSRWLSGQVFIPFVERYPQVRLDLITTNPKEMATMGQCDLMVAPVAPEDNSLIARYQHSFRRYFCASPHYLARFGEPVAPDDLASHRCITNVSVQQDQKNWEWSHLNGETGKQPVTSILSTDSVDIAMQWMLSGNGIASIPASQVRFYQQGHDFKVLFNGAYFQEQSVYVLYHSRNFLPKRHRLLVEHLVSFFEKQRKQDEVLVRMLAQQNRRQCPRRDGPPCCMRKDEE